MLDEHTEESLDGTEEGAESFSFDSSFSEEPLESHPKWPIIDNKYGPSTKDENGKLVFPKTLSVTKSVGTFKKESTSTEKNPMFGETTYLSLRATFKRTRVVSAIPADLLDQVGSIRSSLPAGLPTPADHDWLIMPPLTCQTAASLSFLRVSVAREGRLERVFFMVG